jgi:hypothetical protein
MPGMTAFEGSNEGIPGLLPVLERDIRLICKAACSSCLGFCEGRVRGR